MKIQNQNLQINYFFQSVTARTAGFNSIAIDSLTDSSSLLITILMFIGGSPGSTAGGIKTTTFIILVLAVISTAKHSPDTIVFKRRLENRAIKQASSVFLIYLSLVLISVLIICAVQPLAFEQVLFEAVSAIGTVGLSEGITSSLLPVSKIVIIASMFTGKVGGLSLALFLAEKRNNVPLKRPVEKIIIG